MRQSLSDPRVSAEPSTRSAAGAVASAVVLSGVLAAAAVIDQIGGHSLSDHAAAVYAPYGKEPAPGLLYGLVYTVAIAGAALWLPVLRAVRSRRRSAPVLAVVVTAITATLAVLLPASTEYGARIFPPLWGILASLPPAAGLVAVVLLLRRPR